MDELTVQDLNHKINVIYLDVAKILREDVEKAVLESKKQFLREIYPRNSCFSKLRRLVRISLISL